jgi:hypothetical protein
MKILEHPGILPLARRSGPWRGSHNLSRQGRLTAPWRCGEAPSLPARRPQVGLVDVHYRWYCEPCGGFGGKLAFVRVVWRDSVCMGRRSGTVSWYGAELRNIQIVTCIPSTTFLGHGNA